MTDHWEDMSDEAQDRRDAYRAYDEEAQAEYIATLEGLGLL